MIFKLHRGLLGIYNRLSNPLYKNSIFIMLSSVSKSFFGFLFWLIAAKFYLKEDLGVATALISVMGLIVLFSRVGMDFSLIRFFPLKDKSKVLSTSIIVTTIFSIILTLIYILEIDFFSPELAILKNPLYAAFFIIFLAANSVISLTGIALISIRRPEADFIQNFLMGFRIIFLFLFITFGSIGILSAMGISFLFSLIFSLVFLSKYGISFHFCLDKSFLSESFNFSIANYLAGLLTTGPNMILPLLVLNILGPAETAHYYIAFSISSILYMIPNAVSVSLFVEGSHEGIMKKTVLKSLIMTFLFLFPLVVFLYTGGDLLLGIFGNDYAESSFGLLRIMILSAFFISPVNIYNSVQRVHKDTFELLLLSGIIFIMQIVLSYYFMLFYGLIGIGYAWMMSYCIGLLFVIIKLYFNFSVLKSRNLM